MSDENAKQEPYWYFGWALQTSYSGAESKQDTFAVNLIMPGAARVAHWYAASDAERWQPAQPPNTKTTFEDLLFPWKWGEELEWKVFFLTGDGNAKLVKSIKPIQECSVATSQKDPIRKAFEKYVVEEIKNCLEPFSLAPRFNGSAKDDKGQRLKSLPHAIAPLTHLPAPLSGSALGLSLHLRIPEAESDGFYICFPARFCANGQTFALAVVETLDPKSDTPLVNGTYKAESPFIVENKPCEIVFYGQAVRNGAGLPSGEANIDIGPLPLAQSRAFVARYAHPAIVGARALRVAVPEAQAKDKAQAHNLAQQIAEAEAKAAAGSIEAKAKDIENLKAKAKAEVEAKAEQEAQKEFDVHEDWFCRLFAYCVGIGTITAPTDPSKPEETAGYFPKLFMSKPELNNIWVPGSLLGTDFWGQSSVSKEFAEQFVERLQELEIRKLASPAMVRVREALQSARKLHGKQTDPKTGESVQGSRKESSVWLADAAECLEAFSAAASDPTTEVYFAAIRALCDVVLKKKNPPLADKINAILNDSEGPWKLDEKSVNNSKKRLLVQERMRGFASTAWVHRLSLIKNAWSDSTDPRTNAQRCLTTVKQDLLDLLLSSKSLLEEEHILCAADVLTEEQKRGYRGIKKQFQLKDPPVRISLDQPTTPKDDSQFRGYAVGLQNGLHPENVVISPAQTQWITATGIRMEALGKDFVKKEGEQAPLLMHETIGSTWYGGFRVATAEYSGWPLNARLDSQADSAADDRKPIDIPLIEDVWPINATAWAEDALPLLGYGLYYRARTIQVDNAGGLLGPTDGGDGDAKAQFPLNSWQPKNEERYLSSVRPGPPRLVWTKIQKPRPKESDLPLAATRYSGETKANAYWLHTNRKGADNNPKPPAVFALAKAEDSGTYSTGEAELQSEYSFWLHPPLADCDVIVRWFNTDIVAAAANEDRSDLLSYKAELEGKKPHEIQDISKAWTQLKDSHSERNRGHYHPGVTAFRLRVVWNGHDDDASEHKFSPFDKDNNNALVKDIASAKLPQVKIKTAEPVDHKIGHDAKGWIISVSPGEFMQVFVGSLVLAEFVNEGPKRRLGEDETWERFTDKKTDTAYCVTSESEYWFECLPTWKYSEPPWPDTYIEVEQLSQSGTGRSPDAIVTKLAGEVSQAADWLAGVKLERHEWHWTGYDVQFPDAMKGEKTLESWLSALAATATYRETSESVLDVEWKPNERDWQVPKQVVARLELPPERGARFIAYTASPLLRFAAWVREGKRKVLMDKVAAAGSLIQGCARPSTYLERVPSPAWSWSIPLCATYDAKGPNTNGSQAHRIANGNLLVFDEAIRRTDDLVRLGGIGEVMEIDVVETRVTGVAEQGVNPIFHALSDPNDKFDPNSLSFEATHTFGLTFDIATNPKVAQTGIIVTPVYTTGTPEDRQGKWLMAKMRARRVYLPELMKGSKVEGAWSLPTRVVGDARVPVDFCIDVDAGQPLPKKLSIPEAEYDITLDDTLSSNPPGTRQRLLVSWHFARWRGTDEPTWRPQVLHQNATADSKIGWRLENKKSPYALAQSIALPFSLTQVTVSTDGKAGLTLRQVLLSDYSEAQWLTFIGSFGHALDLSTNYRLFGQGSDSLELQRLVGGRWVPEELTISPPSDKEKVTFQLLMEYYLVKDLMRGRPDVTSGAISRFWQPARNNCAIFHPFKSATEKALNEVPGNEAKKVKLQRFAYLLSFQRINAGKDLIQPTDWAQVLANMFPSPIETSELKKTSSQEADNPLPQATGQSDDSHQKKNTPEAKIRLLPEYLGPIPINE